LNRFKETAESCVFLKRRQKVWSLGGCISPLISLALQPPALESSYLTKTVFNLLKPSSTPVRLIT